MSGWHIGVIGGSGLYDVAGIEDGRWVEVASPWGTPSDAIFTGRVGHARVSFLPRAPAGQMLLRSAYVLAWAAAVYALGTWRVRRLER